MKSKYFKTFITYESCNFIEETINISNISQNRFILHHTYEIQVGNRDRVMYHIYINSYASKLEVLIITLSLIEPCHFKGPFTHQTKAKGC